jgi:cbb3-type cytochrome c oxidase subunit III
LNRLIGLFVCLALGWGVMGSPAWGTDEPVPRGKEIFASTCADCHRENGQGLPGTFPALNNNPFVAGAPQPVIATVLNGLKGNLGQMPAWKDKLDDNQIAAVITYIRQAWSNRAPAVTPAMVAAARSK